MIRRTAAVLAATAMLLVLAAPVFAGGWAEIVADGQTRTPSEGTPIEVGFKVLQHGETPAPWETATVHFTNSSNGEMFDVVAKNDRPDGHFVATTTLSDAGYWSWHVTLKDLESQHVPVRMTVLSASGATPPFDPSTVLSAIDHAKVDVTNSVNERFAADIERLDRQADGYRARLDYLGGELEDVTADRDALAARMDAIEGAGGLPILAVISLSVLAGSAAGFAMAWLAGRQPKRAAPATVLSPSQRGVDAV
ncbi:MAG TPA: hypothetical protein VHK05_02605 [Candidatus Limnocylindrales bacterium]|jgi:hypothetical protein|nr:hypothetical protein [Candidatus Limnocylindrales bacterium]